MKRKAKRLTVEQRWERGIEHDPRSLSLARALRDADFAIGGGGLDLRFGGDGDNGEHLLFLLDDYFDSRPEVDISKLAKKFLSTMPLWGDRSNISGPAYKDRLVQSLTECLRAAYEAGENSILKMVRHDAGSK